MISIYLVSLLIAPQLWLEPLVGVRVDFIIYPAWVLVLAIQGRIARFFDFQSMDYLIVGYIGWVILSALANDSNPLTGKLIFDYVKWFVLYRLVFLSICDIEDVQKVVNRLVILVYVIVVEGIQHKLSPDGIGWAGQPLGWVDQAVLDAGGSGRTQWINIFDGPGVFCVMYTLALPFILQYLDKHYAPFKKYLAIVAMLPLLLAIWYTGSRGGFLATLGIFGCYFLIRNADRIKLSAGKIIMIGALFMVVWMAAPSHLTQVKDDKRSAQHRVDMWMQGVEMVEQNPLFGIGRGNYARYTGRLIAHNSAIENMGELGLPGLFLWIGTFYMAFRNLHAYSTSSKVPNHAALAKGLLICLVGYLISAMFVTLEYETYFFLLGLVAVFANRLSVRLRFTLRDRVNVGSMCIGFYILLRLLFSVYY